jgi:hypothetical protein
MCSCDAQRHHDRRYKDLVRTEKETVIACLKVKKLKQSHCTPVKAQGERRYSSYSFMTSVLDEVSGHGHTATALYARKRIPGTHWAGGWVDPRASQDTEVRGKTLSPLPGIEPRFSGSPVCSQTLH